VVSVNTPYRLNFSLDLSSVSSDTYSFSLTRLSDNTVLATSASIIGRGGNVLPDRLVLDGRAVDAGTSQIDANPYFQINSILVSAIPIPEPTGLALIGALGLAGLRRRRKA